MTTTRAFTLADFLAIPEQQPALEFNTDGSIQQTELAYLAAMIDGEGTLSIHKVRKYQRTGPTNHLRYRLVLQVSNTHRGLMDWLLARFGGRVYTSGRPNGRSVWIWVCLESRQEALLRATLPYLIVKRERALVALEFRNVLSSGKRGRDGWRTPEQTIAQEDCWRRMGLLILAGGKTRQRGPLSRNLGDTSA